MKFKDVVLIATDSIKDRKSRVALNILGILIGISAITALTSLSQGMSEEINMQLQVFGPTTITVTTESGGMIGGTGGTITLRDIDRVDVISGVAVSTPVISKTVEIHIGSYSDRVTVTGIVPDEYVQVYRSIEVAEGRFLKRSDDGSTVLGAFIAHPSQFEEPVAKVGSRITIIANIMGEEKTFTLRVAGILSEIGGFISPDNQIFVTSRTAQRIFETGNTVDQIVVDAEDIESVDSVVEEILDKLGEDVNVISSSFIRDTIGSVTGTMSAVLGGIAAISLVVAGIAIINTMMVSVMERTREIGVMKALGAKSKDILLMFITESLITGIIGGVIGVAFGVFLSQIVSAFIGLTPVLSLEVMAIGIGFAAITGTLAGFYPAQKASKLHPVEALRYE